MPDDLPSVEDHLARILDDVAPLPSREVPLMESLGLTLAADVTAGLSLPRFDNSAMDGYAVRVADLAHAAGHAAGGRRDRGRPVGRHVAGAGLGRQDHDRRPGAGRRRRDRALRVDRPRRLVGGDRAGARARSARALRRRGRARGRRRAARRHRARAAPPRAARLDRAPVGGVRAAPAGGDRVDRLRAPRARRRAGRRLHLRGQLLPPRRRRAAGRRRGAPARHRARRPRRVPGHAARRPCRTPTPW